MTNITCPVCSSIVSDINERCPICGTELKKAKEEFSQNQPQNTQITNNVTFNEPIPYRNEELQQSYYTQTSLPTQQTKIKNSNNGSKSKPLIIIAIVAAIIIISTIFIIASSIINDNSVKLSTQVEDIINKHVETVEVKPLSKEALKIENNVMGNKNIFLNDNFVVFLLEADEFIENDENDYDVYSRHYYIYCNKPSDNVEFSASKYSAELEEDTYNFSANLRSNYSERYSDFEYIEKDDNFKKLNNYAINDLEFEAYYLEESYGSYSYMLFSKPIDKDEHYLSIRISGFPEDNIVALEDVFKYVTTEKVNEEY